MDEFRGKKPHPFFEHCGYPHLIPLDHPDLEKWVDARNFGKSDQHYNTVHKPTNIRFGGGIDDMFVNAKTGDENSHCDTATVEKYRREIMRKLANGSYC